MPTRRKPKYETLSAPANGVVALTKELWQAAVNLRGSVKPADYKRYVLPIIFLRFLSLRYEKRRAELERAIQGRWVYTLCYVSHQPTGGKS
jgi:type I restriction-modification system DNA methylase subunit